MIKIDKKIIANIIVLILISIFCFISPAVGKTLADKQGKDKHQGQRGASRISPVKAACYFLRQMETFLSVEHKKPKVAKAIKNKLMPLMSTENISLILARFHKKIEDIPKENIIKVQTAYLNSWLASINFYTGHIRYEKAKLIRTSTAPNKLIFADIVIPVDRVKQTTPINIFVRCIKKQGKVKADWKIHMIRLFPRFPMPISTMPAKTHRKAKK